MKTTRAGVVLLRIFFFLALLFTACCFIDSWHPQFFLNIGRRVVKLVLAFLLPFLSGLLLCVVHRDYSFIGKASACIMSVTVAGYFADRLFFNLIARIGDDKIIWHFVYSMIAFFSVFLACWLGAVRAGKHEPAFAGFCHDFFTGYVVLAAFLFIIMFFVVRNYNQTDNMQNLIPFKGEIGQFIQALRTGALNKTMLLHTAGNVLYFATVSLTVSVLDKKQRTWLAFIIPVFLSVFVETYQYLTHCGDTDVDDILLNALGALIGILLYQLMKKRAIPPDCHHQ